MGGAIVQHIDQDRNGQLDILELDVALRESRKIERDTPLDALSRMRRAVADDGANDATDYRDVSDKRLRKASKRGLLSAVLQQRLVESNKAPTQRWHQKTGAMTSRRTERARVITYARYIGPLWK